MRQTLLILTLLATSIPTFGSDQPRHIEVVGTGTVSRDPDQARISFAVETQAETAQQATDLNATRTTQLIAAIREHGILESDLRTLHYRLSPRYRTDDRGRQTLDPIGFVAHNTVEVVERRLGKIGGLIDAAIEAGANRIGGIGFELSEPQTARREALSAAVSLARLDAVVIARASGQKLGEILQIVSHGGSPVPRSEHVMMATRQADTPIETGALQVSARVTVRFALKD